MGRGAAAIVARLREEGRCGGALALGGTSIAFRSLPLGMAKLIVLTAASGDTRAYVGESGLVLIPSVVDVAGVNRLSARILANAAATLAGMVTAERLALAASGQLCGVLDVTTTELADELWAVCSRPVRNG